MHHIYIIYYIRVCCNSTTIVNIFGLFLLKSNAGCRSIFARTQETIRRRPADSICQYGIQTLFRPDSLTFLVIFQVAVKVIRNFTQDLLAAIQVLRDDRICRKSSVLVSLICYFEIDNRIE